jgi:hypothetical protein
VIDRRKRARKNGKAEENGAINTSKKGKTFLDLLLELEQQGKLDGKEVREQTDTFLFAGQQNPPNSQLIWPQTRTRHNGKCTMLDHLVFGMPSRMPAKG